MLKLGLMKFNKTMAQYNFDDLVENIRNNKKVFYENRFEATAESTREVYLSACQTIANYYEQYGFKYSKSGQHLTFKTKKSEYILRISFSSSHYNAVGENIAITVSANVLSHQFKKWKVENKIGQNPVNEYIGGGNIGNLQEKHTYLKWNLANTSTRESEIENIIERINALAIPFFDSFNDVENLFKTIKNSNAFFGIKTLDSADFLNYISSQSKPL